MSQELELKETDGGIPNVAPKTHVMPVGRHNFWAFACRPNHHTYQNVVQRGEFVINVPGPELIAQISRAS
jgi:flavin reductase (DIM6/NTAB) family NADH-FMN oxidoreductase RutF